MQRQSPHLSQVEQSIQSQIQNLLKPLIEQEAPFKDYCLISQKALQLPIERFVQHFDLADKSESKPPNGNHKNFVLFLYQPNVKISLPPTKNANGDKINQTEEMKKRRLDCEDAGQKIVKRLSFAWNYYARMAKGFMTFTQAKVKQQHVETKSQSMVYNKRNIEIAKRQISAMLTQMHNAKYHWENFTIQGLRDWEEQKKQIQEEQTFTNFLNNTLVRQIEKIDKLRKAGRSVARPAEQIHEQRASSDALVEDNTAKKSISQLIDVKKYFQNRKQRLQKQKTQKDPISQVEQRRKFNAAVFRYTLAQNQ